MPLVSTSIPNLINGVSQQPAALRLASQAESVVNCMSSAVEGLKKRPPMNNIARLFTGSAGSTRPFIHVVDRDGTVQYLVIITDGDLKVFDLDGTAKTITFPDGKTYLDVANSADPSSQFRVASVADYTFITNREKTVAMDSATSTAWGTKSMVFIKAANYDTTYRVTLAGTQKSYTTPAVGSGTPDTITIASQLASQLNTISGYTVTASDYIIRITKDDGADYTVTSSDTKTGMDTSVIKETVSSMDDLPVMSEHGFTTKIQGTVSTQLDDYYVKFEASAGSGFGGGIWRETVGPGIVYKFDATTMPHTLVRNANGTFTFQKFDWSGRVAGDAVTAVQPSFVGSTIQNLNLFRNRLVFLADESVILSAADSYDRFWPETVQTVVDSDPIDLSTGGTEINFLVSSASFANTLLLFSTHGQFRLDSGTSVGNPLTPKTANITSITTFDMDSRTDPIAVGRNIYFPVPKGDFTGLREFFLPDNTGSVPISEEVTASVPRFIPKNLTSLITSVSEDMIAAVSKDQPKRIYLYKFFFEDDTKLQSAWSYWEAKGSKSILGAAIIDSDMYVVVEYSDGVYLEHIILRPENIDPNTEIELLLDRKTTEASCTTAVTNPGGLGVQTTITLPYPMATTGTMAVVGRYDSTNNNANNTIKHGEVIMPTSETLTGGTSSNGTMVVKGDLSAAKFYVGELYDMNYEFSTPYLKESPSGGGIAVAAGPKLQMRTWTVVFDETSAFELKVTPAGRDIQTYPFNGVTVGQSPPLIGNPSIDTGNFRVPVMASNTDTKVELFSSSPLPCRFQSAEWEGWLHSRTSRM
tara:strand:- start:16355 stop:18790 length:2436 start_codon:yes stop_codon:yes gene_type:complete